MYSVNFWGSKPGDNDDCFTGFDFEEKEAALKFYAGVHPIHYAWIELDGPDIHEERKNPHYKRRDDREWQREIAMEAGMLHGCDAYNDAMGY